MSGSASEADLPRVAALLAARGERISVASLRARLGDDDGGILVSGAATVSWALDGGALHLYDFAGDPLETGALVESAEQLARARFAAVLAASLYEDDPALASLRVAGFSDDSDEPAVRAGAALRLHGLVREVT